MSTTSQNPNRDERAPILSEALKNNSNSDHFGLAEQIYWGRRSSGAGRGTQDQLNFDHFELEDQLDWIQRRLGTVRGTQEQLDSDDFVRGEQLNQRQWSSGAV
ncbi:hypothetical protein MVEG_12317 [Podila verticillata NRRL 6337]|uniref:Uncharacterized protein n=1 Tax=Podila verticillata NRRL 6337 TaxID=1069443 RepID=A0A086TIN1_9FUNG|nr:hypothetical protein MVEG_12317 [Podila verticillata NRRL 6337]